MFPYLTLHDATQTRNKNLLISHCYLTLALHTLLSPILVTITRSSHWNTKRIFGLRCQKCSLLADKEPRHDITDIPHHSRARPLSPWCRDLITQARPAWPAPAPLVTLQTTDPGPAITVTSHLHSIWSLVFQSIAYSIYNYTMIYFKSTPRFINLY